MLPVSLSAAFHTTRLALPHMRRQNWGRIINIASVHGKVASPYKSAYVAAKHGMLGLTKVTALETADTPITANSICPGWVMTELVAAQVRSNAEAAGIPFEQAATELLSVSPTILAGIWAASPQWPRAAMLLRAGKAADACVLDAGGRGEFSGVAV